MSEDFERRLRALVNPTRRRILAMCWNEARAAGDLSSRIDLAPASVSEHVKALSDAGLVDVSRIGTWRFYRTNTGLVDKTLDELSDEFAKARRPDPSPQ